MPKPGLFNQIVLTQEGNKNISDIKVGDILLGADNKKNTVKSIEILKYKKVILNGGEYSFSSNQSIFVNGKCVHAKDIKIGDFLEDKNKQKIEILNVKIENKKSDFYKLDVENDHTYFINNILVHNASRYWVGGTGDWDASTTTHWSDTSGGSGGSSVPTSSDSVILDGSSGGGIVTLTATANCSSLTCGAFTGTLDTNDQTVNVTGVLSISGAGTRTITLGSSAINCATWTATTTTGLTFNAETSTITQTGTNKTFNSGGLTYSSIVLSGLNISFVGASSFTNLTVTGVDNKYNYVKFSDNISISGTLTLNGYSATSRLLVRSSSIGTAITITIGSTTTGSYVDFMDIAMSGAVNLSAITGGSGNCGGNTNITFTTADDWYWHADTGNFSDYSKWYTATNGGGSQMASTLVPLPQDTCYFDSNSFDSASQVVTQDMVRLPSVIWTGATNTPTFTLTGTGNNFFGHLTLISGMTFNHANTSLNFAGRGNFNITTGGKEFYTIYFGDSVTGATPYYPIGGTYTLQDNLTLYSGVTLNLVSGTFDLNDKDLIGGTILINGSTFIMGNGTISLSSAGNTWNCLSGTITAEGSTIKFTANTSNAKNFVGGGKTYNNFWDNTTGTGITIIKDSNTFNDFKIEAGSEVNFTDGTDQTVTSLTAIGTLANKITMHGTGTAGWKISCTTGTINCEWLVLNYSTAEGGATFNATNTTGANNSGWNISGPFDTRTTTITAKANIQIYRYWVGGTGNWDASDTTHWSLTSGGAGGASVPTSTQNVIFDSNSASDDYTVTILATANCANLSINKPTGAGKKITLDCTSSQNLNIYGNLDLIAGVAGMTSTLPATLSVNFKATSGTKTIKTYGIGIGRMDINGSGGTFQLLDTLTLDSSTLGSNQYNLSYGTFDPNGQTVSVKFTNHNNTYFIGSWPLYDLTITGRNNVDSAIYFYTSLTISNTLTINGNSVTNRVGIRTDGSVRTLTAKNIVISNANFTKIALTTTGISGTVFSESGTITIDTNFNIKLTGALTGDITFAGGGATYNNIWNATTNNYALIVSGSNTFNDFKIDAGRTVKFTNSTTTTVTTFTALGTSGAHIIISNTSGTTHATLTKAGGGVISGCDYIDIQEMTGSPATTWYIGNHSTDVGSTCTNILLSDPFYTKTTSATAKSRLLKEGVIKTILVKANIIPNWTTRTQIVSAKSRIQIINVTKTIQAKSRIEIISARIISVKASIFKTLLTTSQAKSSIAKTQDQVITSLARIEILSSSNISAIGNILQTNSSIISAKSNIKNTLITSVQAKTNIRNTDGKIVSAKAELMKTSDIISGITHAAMANGAQNKIVKDSNGNLYVAGIRKNTSNKNGVFISRSTDNGLTWLWNWQEAISDEAVDYTSCAIAIDSNNDLHVVAQDTTRIRYRKYDLSEGTWADIVDVQEAALTTGNQSNPSIAIDSTNQVYVVWHGFTTANQSKTNIRFRKTVSNSWQTVVEITAQNTVNNINAQVAINSNGYIEVVWQSGDGNIYIKEYTTSWQTAESLTTGDFYDTQSTPDIACDSNGKSLITWFGKKAAGDTYTKIRAIFGSRGAWGAISDLTDGSVVIYAPTVTCDNYNNYTVFWTEVVGAYKQVKHRSFGGVVWEQVYTLTTSSINKYYVSIFNQLYPTLLRPSSKRLVTGVSGDASDYQLMGDYWLVTENITVKANIKAPVSKTILSKASVKQGGVGLIITSKARIQKMASSSVSSKANIQVTTNRTILSKGRVKIIDIAVIISAKASIKKTDSTTSLSKANILNTLSATIFAKADIKQASVVANITSKARLEKMASSTITSLGRILTAGIGQTIIAKASIGKTQDQTIQAKADIFRVYSTDLDAKARIEKTVSSVILAKTSIFNTNLNLITSKASIKVFDVITTISAKACLTYTNDSTIEAKGRITATANKNILAKGSIKIGGISSNISALGRIEITSSTEIQTKSNLRNTQNQLVTSLGRIEITSGKLIQSKANLKNTLDSNISGKGDIWKEVQTEISALGRIEILTGKSILAKANILNTQDEIITAKARIETEGNPIIIQAKANLMITSERAVESKANIKVTTDKSILAKASIEQFGNGKTISAKGAILVTQETSVQAKSRITITSSSIINSIANIQATEEENIFAKASIFISDILQTISSKARVQLLSLSTISALANLRGTVNKNIISKGSIKALGAGKTIQAKASIKILGVTIIISSKASIIKKGTGHTISALGDIKKTKSSIIRAKANIQSTSLGKIVRAKAAIKKLANRSIIAKAALKKVMTKTITAKGRLQQNITQTISAVASIAIKDYLTLEAFKSETVIDISDYTDTKLQEYINRAQKMIDSWLGGNIGFSSYISKDIRCMYDYPRSGLAIQLPKRPITSIRKIVVTFAPNVTITWDTPAKIATWRINEEVGYIEYFGLDLVDFALNVYVRDPLASNVVPMAEITYYTGYPTIPTEVTKATEILVEQLIRNEQGDDIDLTSVAIGNYREGYKRSAGIKSMGIIGGGDQVESLLRPYRQPGKTMFTSGPF